MKINIRFDTDDSDNCENKEYTLNGDDLKSFLLCNGIGHNGSYFRIKNKVFDDSEGSFSITVITERDNSVII